jgi:hypothetical protein
MADDRLAEIAARVLAATKGTWGTYYDGTAYHLAADMYVTDPTSGRPIGSIPDGNDKTQAFHNAMFIGRALDDVRWLLAELAETTTKLAVAERQAEDLDAKLTERTQQLNGLLALLAIDEKAVPA